MSKWKYFFRVRLPLWWKEVKAVFNFIIGALLFLCVLLPKGYLADKKERRKSAKI
jgi:hypothetical protein